MNQLSENPHAQKIFWILLCTVCSFGLALVPMLINYNRLWTFSCPSLTVRVADANTRVMPAQTGHATTT